MKRWVLLLLAVLCAASGGLAEAPSPQPTRYAPGEDISLRLCVTAPGVAGLQLCLSWDTQVFELVDTKPELAAFFREAAMLSAVHAETEAGVLTMVWLRETDVQLTDVCVLELMFRVREDAAGGVSTISIEKCLLADIQGKALVTQTKDMEIGIDAPTAAAGLVCAKTTVSTPMPEPAAAFVWLVDAPRSELETAGQGTLFLMDESCPNVETELRLWQTPSQEMGWRIQPMDDLTEKGAGVQ